jgi:hypothetical protein
VNLHTALLLASTSPSPAPGTPDPDTVNAGWWGFLGLLFLSIAVFFLWKSMNTQLKRVQFDEVPVDPDDAADVDAVAAAEGGTDGDAAAAVDAVDEPSADR